MILARSINPVNSGVGQGCVLGPSLFNACMDWAICKVVDSSHCRASDGDIKITDLFLLLMLYLIKLLEVMVMALEVVPEKMKTLGLKVSWARTGVQSFGGFLDDSSFCSCM